jgi:hypothetical protein
MTALSFIIPPTLWLTANRHTTNRGHRARIVSDLHQLAAATAHSNKLARIEGQVALDWLVRYPKGVRVDKGDPVNASATTKALLDGLVPTWLPDDGPKFVVAETFRRGLNLTVPGLHEITLTITSQEVPWI